MLESISLVKETQKHIAKYFEFIIITDMMLLDVHREQRVYNYMHFLVIRTWHGEIKYALKIDLIRAHGSHRLCQKMFKTFQ